MTLPIGDLHATPRTRRVRTLNGVLRYGAPIGAAITTRLAPVDPEQPALPDLVPVGDEEVDQP